MRQRKSEKAIERPRRRWTRLIAMALAVTGLAIFWQWQQKARGWTGSLVDHQALAGSIGAYREIRFERDKDHYTARVAILPAGAYMARLVDRGSSNGSLQKLSELARQSDATIACSVGFVDASSGPLGLLKVDGQSIAPMSGEVKLSGLLVIDALGTLQVDRNSINPDTFASALQAGPFLIEPGGQITDDLDDKTKTERCVIVVGADQTILLMQTTAVDLRSLANCLAAQPELFGVAVVDRALLLADSGGIRLAIDNAIIHTREREAKRTALIITSRSAPVGQ